MTKIAVIMRGLPGSGKSSFTSLLSKHLKDVSVHSIDDLHTDHTGNFHWSEDLEPMRYMTNYANFIKSCEKQTAVVVADCINVKVSDFQDYIKAARAFGYQPYVVTPELRPSKELSRRNNHHVSSVHIKEMTKQWESWPTKKQIEDLTSDDK